MRWIARLLGGCAAVGLLTPPYALAAAAATGNPLVVELFTSQGCSSCPPADALAAEFARTRPDLLVLDFHVDYWNQLGWHDPFSLAAATARQQGYAALLHTDLYTPQMVVGGSAQAIGSAPVDVADAIASAEARRAAQRGVPLRLVAIGGTLNLSVGSGTGPATLWLVGFDTWHKTAIGRGENDGLTETEANIVRSITPLGPWRGAPLVLNLAPPAGERVAVLLQRPDGAILSAAVLAPASP